MLVGVFVHPECREVFPLAPEPIPKQDGSNKNDCKRNAGKRFLSDLCREHPHLKLIAVENGLVPNGPQIRLFIEKDLHFILGVRPGDHEALFDQIEVDPNAQKQNSRMKTA